MKTEQTLKGFLEYLEDHYTQNDWGFWISRETGLTEYSEDIIKYYLEYYNWKNEN